MLDILGLTHVYRGGARALDGIDLSVKAGLIGLLGPNGAGKSTLMRALATVQHPTAGSIRFEGIDVLSQPERLRPVLGYLPQDFGVYPGVSVRRMLDHMAVLKGIAGKGERREAVDGLLNHVNLWGARDRRLSSLSGGMIRRFGVAQALLGAPRLVVMDEPTAGLDPAERGRLFDLLADTAEHAIVVLSTHIVPDVTDLCSRVVLLAGGRVRLDGSPDDLVRALKGRVWRKVVERRAGRAEGQHGAVISTRLVGGRLALRAVGTEPPDTGYQAAEPRLEDVYFSTLRALGHA